MTTAQDHRAAPIEGAAARFRGVRASRAVESIDVLAEPERLAAGGWWAVVGGFSGTVRAWRFADVERSDDGALPQAADVATPPDIETLVTSSSWTGPDLTSWRSSMDQSTYEAAVDATRSAIREGDVYQANICRVLRAPLPPTQGPGGSLTEPAAPALAALLAHGNPAPYGGYVHVPRGGAVPGGGAVPHDAAIPGVWVVTASPELYLRRAGQRLTSAPIKGTAHVKSGLADKDRAENVMITDLVRNDLQRVCAPGTVEVSSLLAVEHHPGLVHLVSTVTGELDPGVASARDSWGRILTATYPPGSVSGAPKSSALHTIAQLEPEGRGPYCGTVGWIDADRGTAELAVAIRTFWWNDDDGGTLRFGTGAGITWGSDPAQEWAETELKAARLVAIASNGQDWDA